VFAARVLRKILGHMRNEVKGDWRRQRNEQLYDPNSSPNIIRVIKSRTRWAGRVALWGERRAPYGVRGANLQESDHSKNEA